MLQCNRFGARVRRPLGHALQNLDGAFDGPLFGLSEPRQANGQRPAIGLAFVHYLPPIIGEADLQAAAIGRILAAIDQPFLHRQIDCTGKRRGAAIQRFGNIAKRRGLHLGDGHQHRPLLLGIAIFATPVIKLIEKRA